MLMLQELPCILKVDIFHLDPQLFAFLRYLTCSHCSPHPASIWAAPKMANSPTSPSSLGDTSKQPGPAPPLAHHATDLGQRYGRADHLVFHTEGPEDEVTRIRHLFKRPIVRQVSHRRTPSRELARTDQTSGSRTANSSARRTRVKYPVSSSSSICSMLASFISSRRLPSRKQGDWRSPASS